MNGVIAYADNFPEDMKKFLMGYESEIVGVAERLGVKEAYFHINPLLYISEEEEGPSASVKVCFYDVNKNPAQSTTFAAKVEIAIYDKGGRNVRIDDKLVHFPESEKDSEPLNRGAK